MKLNHKAVTDHQNKYAYVMRELLLNQEQLDPNQSTTYQLNPISERRVTEYDDMYSECDDECDNVREYDSDDDHFYYD